jgi:ADP-ribose pyrophosphatase YjhB (NUDIX family)
MSTAMSLKKYESLSCNPAIFMERSLDELKKSLLIRPYPGYPRTRFHDFYGRQEIPRGPWCTTDDAPLPTPSEQQCLTDKGLGLDNLGRPLHPWFHNMVTDPDLGVVAGRGFYWNWGPNYTADPIVFRHDLEETYVLLIVRSDTRQLALPGGFIDENEEPLQAAIREAGEEALINLESFAPCAEAVYSGPVADIRSTAHAWAETAAFKFDLPVEATASLPTAGYTGGDDALHALWMPVSKISDRLFGSHRLLIELALDPTQS